MRIDGSTFSHSPERSTRTEVALTPYRALPPEQAGQEQDGLLEGREAVAPTSGAEPDLLSSRSQWLAARAVNPGAAYSGSLSLHALTALSSYGSTANMVSNLDATEVLGLDLYA
jgi:hypothetical protein